ncbi:MAG: sigma-70 family RNA polymerase sigma factor [Bacteroidetes bacterium]|nr:sigma-70 family RNA polymerase sigma factor [Bacteroidota bacterium]
MAIYTAFRNFCIDRYRKNKRNIPVDFSTAWNYADEDENESQLTCTLQAGADPSDLLHNRMVMDLMRHCIMKLRPRDRKVLLMRHMKDMKNPEIAKAIGLSTAATANVMKRAIASLRAIFKSRNIEPW